MRAYNKPTTIFVIIVKVFISYYIMCTGVCKVDDNDDDDDDLISAPRSKFTIFF